MGKCYGYARVSTKEQKEDRQIVAISRMHVPRNNIFVDKESGKDFERTYYKKLVRQLREDDVLYISNVDILDGTPLLDIKPYVPQLFEDTLVDDIKIGWFETKHQKAKNQQADDRFIK